MSDDSLQNLHGVLSRFLIAEIKKYEHEDELPRGAASIIKEARELLKQNNVGEIELPESASGTLKSALEEYDKQSHEVIPFPQGK